MVDTMRTSTQYNTVSANDSARSRSKNPTMHAILSTAKPQPRHHRRHVGQRRETRNRGTTSRSRMWARRRCSCVTGAAAKVIPPGCVHLRMSVRMWTKLEQNHAATLTATCLTWTVLMILLRASLPGEDHQVAKWGWLQRRERVTHQALRVVAESCQKERWGAT